MMLSTVLTISAIFAGNFVMFGQLASSTDVEFTQIVKNGTDKFNVEFTKILFDELEPNENFVFSPLNIYIGLALMHLGATNTTKNELSGILRFPTEESKLTAAHQYLGQTQNDRSSFGSYARTKVASGVFIQKGVNLSEKYVEGATNYYNNGFQLVDFANDGPEAINVINKWVASNTENLIPSMFQDVLPTDTNLLSVSASYFSGSCPYYFSYIETKSFYTGTKSLSVPTMRFNGTLRYFSNEILKFEAIGIRFWVPDEKYFAIRWKGEFSLLIILPQKGESMRTLISSLKPELLSEAINSPKFIRKEWQIPLFKFGWSQDIIQHLKKLGVKRLFEEAALDNIAHLDNSVISHVTHAAGIKITAHNTSRPNPDAKHHGPVLGVFCVNRPFLFLIYHEISGHILLSGLIQNPVGENA